MNKRLNIVNQPGTFLAKELEERKISQVKFAQLIDTTEAEVSNIIHGKKNITPRIAYRNRISTLNYCINPIKATKGLGCIQVESK